MFKFFQALVFCIKNSDYINKVVEETRKKEEQEKKKKEQYRLRLCEKHNPIEGLTNYAKTNCDYCNLRAYLGSPRIVPDCVTRKFYYDEN